MYAVVQEYTRERRQQLDRIKAQIEMNGCTFSVRMSILTTCLRPHDQWTCGIFSHPIPTPVLLLLLLRFPHPPPPFPPLTTH